jgi:hypothetical protein
MKRMTLWIFDGILAVLFALWTACRIAMACLEGGMDYADHAIYRLREWLKA